MTNQCRFGAITVNSGVLFQVWAHSHVELILDGDPRSPLAGFTRRPDGISELFVPGISAGARYGFRINGFEPLPDPASRSQPGGVHGLSEVIDPAYLWSDHGFTPAPWNETVIYELHCGAFTPDGTFLAAADHLAELSGLGITAIELMPIAEFPGNRNWGYDGVSLYAPSRNYGTPGDLRALVDRAHRIGLSVYLDLVFSHFGPDGAYHRHFHPAFYSSFHKTPWGEGLNFDEPGCEVTRKFLIDCGRHWIAEYHIDGFRLDATHAIWDRSLHHFVTEFTASMRDFAHGFDRQIVVMAEDSRNLAGILLPPKRGGWDADAVWADDFHHHVRHAVAGDREGYFADFSGTPSDIARTMSNGWYFEGQHSNYLGHHRGTKTDGIDRSRFIISIDNHDQSGNRAIGDRLHQRIPNEKFRAASALLLFAPETPLLFMGQEWSSSSPFQYFTDHGGYLGQAVTDGRLNEFAHFSEFTRLTVPDPEAEATFLNSKLKWEERQSPPFTAALRWYRAVLALRQWIHHAQREWHIQDAGDVIFINWGNAADNILVAVSLNGGGEFTIPRNHAELLLCSEDSDFTDRPAPPRCKEGTIAFSRAGCLVFQIGGAKP